MVGAGNKCAVDWVVGDGVLEVLEVDLYGSVVSDGMRAEEEEEEVLGFDAFVLLSVYLQTRISQEWRDKVSRRTADDARVGHRVVAQSSKDGFARL